MTPMALLGPSNGETDGRRNERHGRSQTGNLENDQSPNQSVACRIFCTSVIEIIAAAAELCAFYQTQTSRARFEIKETANRGGVWRAY